MTGDPFESVAGIDPATGIAIDGTGKPIKGNPLDDLPPRRRRKRTTYKPFPADFCIFEVFDILQGIANGEAGEHFIRPGVRHDPKKCPRCAPHVVTLCWHCRIDEPRNPKGSGLCRWCSDRKRKDGYLPTPDDIRRHTRRREKGA
jgi:hypothetical protein